MAAFLSRTTNCLVAGLAVAGICLSLSTAVQARNGGKAVGAAIGIGVGLLLLNEVAKAAQSEKRPKGRSEQKYVAPRSGEDGGNGEARPRRSVKAKADPKSQSPDKTDQAVVETPKVVNGPKVPRPDLPSFPDKQRDYIYALPDKPAARPEMFRNSVLTHNGSIVARDQALVRRFTGFSAGPAAAALTFVELATAKGTIIDANSVRERAAAAYAADADLVNLTTRARLGAPALKEDRVQALIIGQAWRIVEKAQADPGLDETARATILGFAFQKAASDVLAQTQAAVEAARLTRSADTLIGALNDVTMRGGQNAELAHVANDRGKSLIRVLEAEVSAVEAADRIGLAASYEVRRKLVDCVALRLPAVVDATLSAGGPAPLPIERAAASTSLSALRGPIVDAIASDAKQSCAQLLAPVRQAPILPASNGPPGRKASLSAGDRPQLAGQPIE